MANKDAPRGFRAVKTLSGRPVNAVLRSVGVTDGADMFLGDMLTLTSNLAAVSATNDTAFLGVAVGFGKVDADGIPLGPHDPDNLGRMYYDDSASTHTDWVVYYAPVEDCIFEGQTDADLDLSVGDTADLLATAGSTTTGRSAHEVDANTNADFTIIELPHYPDNDNALANALVWFIVTPGETAFSG